MRSTTARLLLVLVLIANTLAGCGAGSLPKSASSSKSISVTSIRIAPSSAALKVGQARQLEATATWSDSSTSSVTGIVAWSTDTPSVTSVGTPATSNPGVITGLAVGDATISATDSSSGATAHVSVSVAADGTTLESIDITPDVQGIAVRSKMQLTATGTFSSGPVNITPNVSWTSSDASVLSVDRLGVLTASTPGSAQITARDPTTGIQDRITLSVNNVVLVSLAVSPARVTLPSGTAQPLIASATYSDGTVQDLTPFVTWSSSNIAVATMSSSGLLTAVSSGSIEVTAIDPSTSVSATASVDVP